MGMYLASLIILGISLLTALFLPVLYFTHPPEFVEMSQEFQSFYGGLEAIDIFGQALQLLGVSSISLTRWYYDYAARQQSSDAPVEVEEVSLRGVECLVYRPAVNLPSGAAPTPAVVYLHGGGYDRGSARSDEWLTSSLAQELEAVVISVNYRLAPEHPFPAALEDCLNATLGVMEAAHRFNVDPNRIALAGSGSGGGLAVSTLLRLPKAPTRPKLLVLLQPWLQAAYFDLPSHRVFRQRHERLWRRHFLLPILRYAGAEETDLELLATSNHTALGPRLAALVRLDHNFLPDNMRDTAYKQDRRLRTKGNEEAGSLSKTTLDPAFSPLLSNHLPTLPPVYVSVARHDPCRDEGALLARRLQVSKRPVRLVYHKEGSSPLTISPFADSNSVGGRAWTSLLSYLSSML